MNECKKSRKLQTPQFFPQDEKGTGDVKHKDCNDDSCHALDVYKN